MYVRTRQPEMIKMATLALAAVLLAVAWWLGRTPLNPDRR